jgi:hypothetical protein
MLTKPARILCIGKDFGLLRSRVALLTNAGYDCQAAMLHEAEGVLRIQDFDLIILSASLSDKEGDYITNLIGDRAPILKLREFTPDLLAMVGRTIAEVSQLQLSPLAGRVVNQGVRPHTCR